MTDLPKRLEAAGRKEAENLYPCGHDFKMRLSGLSSCGCCLSTLSDYRARASLHPLIQKMAEALEKINEKAFLDTIRCECCDDGIDGAPCTCFTYNSSELLGEARNISRDAIAELEKYLGGV